MGAFKKINIFVILFSIFLTVDSYSEIVKKIDIKGNDRIASETIVVFGDIVVGKNYEDKDINLLIKKLYETTFFSNISVELTNNKLVLLEQKIQLLTKLNNKLVITVQ